MSLVGDCFNTRAGHNAEQSSNRHRFNHIYRLPITPHVAVSMLIVVESLNDVYVCTVYSQNSEHLCILCPNLRRMPWRAYVVSQSLCVLNILVEKLVTLVRVKTKHFRYSWCILVDWRWCLDPNRWGLGWVGSEPCECPQSALFFAAACDALMVTYDGTGLLLKNTPALSTGVSKIWQTHFMIASVQNCCFVVHILCGAYPLLPFFCRSTIKPRPVHSLIGRIGRVCMWGHVSSRVWLACMPCQMTRLWWWSEIRC
jgi:hypothetical protein